MQNFEVIVIDDQHILEKIGNIQTQISATFLKENYQQLSFSEEELRQKKVGILGTLFPPSWRDPAQLDRVAAEGEPSFLRDTLQDCPTLLILLYDASKRVPASERDVLGCMSLGCVMENMWLMAQSLGIGMQILSVFSSNDVEQGVRRLLQIPEERNIAFAARLGYPFAQPMPCLRVRREVELFVHHNRFGQPDMD
jgi:nitroreductase